MKVTFTADFDFDPAALGGRVTIAYRQGETHTVTRECAEKAIAAGKAAAAKRKRGNAGEGAKWAN